MMFDRRAHLLDAIRTLATFTGEKRTGSRTKDEPLFVVSNFAHSYAVYRRLFPGHLSRIDSRPLEKLFHLVKEVEAQEAKPIEWLVLDHDVKENRHWNKFRELATQCIALIQALPRPQALRPITPPRLPVVYYTADHIENPPTKEEAEPNGDGFSENDANWGGLRLLLLDCLEKHGLTAPDDPADDPHFYLVDDRYNEERYHYLEVYRPSVMTLHWLKDLTSVLRLYPGWGVGVKNLRESYLLIFETRLMVSGRALQHCKDVASVLGEARQLV
jgi:hypothetical protein